MKSTIDKAADGRWLVKVIFKRDIPGPGPDLEAIYQLYWPENFTILADPIVLMPLSVTRMDTRVSIELTLEETQEVMEAAVQAADKYNQGEGQ